MHHLLAWLSLTLYLASLSLHFFICKRRIAVRLQRGNLCFLFSAAPDKKTDPVSSSGHLSSWRHYITDRCIVMEKLNRHGCLCFSFLHHLKKQNLWDRPPDSNYHGSKTWEGLRWGRLTELLGLRGLPVLLTLINVGAGVRVLDPKGLRRLLKGLTQTGKE